MSLSAQTFFKVVELKRESILGENKNSNEHRYYRIVIADADTTKVFLPYPLIFPKKMDTLKAIKELLRFEGNENICVFPIMGYSSVNSQLYMSNETNYSLQIEALFIINQLAFDAPFLYSPYPVLKDVSTNSSFSVSDRRIRYAFKAYKKWYYKLCKIGIQKAREMRLRPLDGAPVIWY